MTRIWTFAIDRGGTFTDIVASSSDGRRRIEKLLSENPHHHADAALAGKSSAEHLDTALPHVAGVYAGEHWLATFALLAFLAGPTPV